MRVLWLSPGFAGDEKDLNCLPSLQLLAQAMSAQGIDIQIITLGYPLHQKPYLWHGILVLSGYGFNGKWFRWLNWFRVLRYAKAAHQQQKFDLIHSFWLGPAWLIGRRLQKRWKIPHLTTLMGQDVLPENLYRHFLQVQHCANLVAVSEYQNDIFEQTTGQRAAHTIPWGISRAEIPALLPKTRSIDILGCGAFIPLKNWALWLQVVAKVAQKRPDLKVVLIGDGTDKPVLEALIQQTGLAHIVRLQGHLPRAEVLAFMQQSRVFLHTSTFESFGLVLTEAAMNGCRVVSTPVGIALQFSALGETLERLTELTLLALDEPLLDAPHLPYLMDQTAQEYLNLYHLKPN